MHFRTSPKRQSSTTFARWRTEIRCGDCDVPMLALVGGRSLCAKCQATEPARLAELGDELDDRLGADGARAAIAAALRGWS